MAKNGLILIKPVSITSAGTGNSSSIGTNGGVTFSLCTSLILDGVFSQAFPNYTIVGRFSAINSMYMRLRTDTATDVTPVYFDCGSLVTGAVEGNGFDAGVQNWFITENQNARQTGFIINVHNPYMQIPTLYRSVSITDRSNAALYDYSGFHTLSVSYRGFELFPLSSSMTGQVAVYGVRG